MCDLQATKDLLNKAITWASKQTAITDQQIKVIKHARQSLLFNEEKPWMKKGSTSTFDVTMGSYDGARICELVGLFILERLGETFGHENIGLYRDDGLAALKNVNGRQADKSRKTLIEIFNGFGLKITVQTN